MNFFKLGIQHRDPVALSLKAKPYCCATTDQDFLLLNFPSPSRATDEYELMRVGLKIGQVENHLHHLHLQHAG
jgi:hypothetical protein